MIQAVDLVYFLAWFHWIKERITQNSLTPQPPKQVGWCGLIQAHSWIEYHLNRNHISISLKFRWPSWRPLKNPTWTGSEPRPIGSAPLRTISISVALLWRRKNGKFSTFFVDPCFCVPPCNDLIKRCSVVCVFFWNKKLNKKFNKKL